MKFTKFGRVGSISAMLAALTVARAAEHPCITPKPLGLVGSVAHPQFYNVGLDVKDGYAFVADWNQTFRVYNTNDPCNPTLIQSLPQGQELSDIAVFGNYAYLANDANGLVVYNISDPGNPTRVANRNDGAYAWSVFYKGGDYAYVGYTYTKNMAGYNVSGVTGFPPIPAPLNYYEFPGSSRAHVWDVAVRGNRAYVWSRSDFPNDGNRLRILDISNPAAPVRRGYLDWTGFAGIGELRVQGNYVYIADNQILEAPGYVGGLRVVDISNEDAPVLVRKVDIPDVGMMVNGGLGLAVEGNRAYVGGKGGLYEFDISTPSLPVLVTVFPLPAGFGNASAGHVEIRDNLAYVTIGALDQGSKGGLAIYKLYKLNAAPVADAGPDQTVACAGPNGATVTLTSASFDSDGDVIQETWYGPLSSRPIAFGPTATVTVPANQSHIFRLVVSDPSGASSSDTVTVNVRDIQAPTLSFSLSPNELWPPNHKMVNINASIQRADVCDPNPQVSLVGITSNEPDNGQGDGDEPNDIQQATPGTDDRQFLLRAERQGSGSGRVYTVRYRVTDAAGNTATASGTVRVPHDKGKN